MQDIDAKAIGVYGLGGLVLMERAGLKVAERVKALGIEKVAVLCGNGNNGGDGLVVARNLHNWGHKVKALMVGGKGKMSAACLSQYNTARKMGVPIEIRSRFKSADFHGAVVVDAIFGTGLGKDISGPIKKAIADLNASGAQVVSVDIPSGISSDTGAVMGAAVRATATVTFGLPKIGHFLHPGAEYSGELFVEDIGFPPSLTVDERLRCNILDKSEMSLLLPERPPYSHKGSFGHVFLIAGSRGKTGAALMAAKASLRAGAGLVTIGIPEYLTGSFQSAVREEMLLPLPDTGKGELSAKGLSEALDFLEGADVLALGPGLGRAEETAALIRELALRSTAPMVIDADAINALEGRTGILGKVKAPVVLTPHPGEFSRLSDMKKTDIEKNRVGSAAAFAKKTGSCLILKGVPTVVAEPDGEVFINPTGNPGMAKAGAGDVLTGIVAAFMAQGLSPLEASLLGPYMHGLAGNMAASRTSMHSLLATDIIEAIPDAFNSLRCIDG